ncbi:MAG: extracellular solute-binding protein [Caldilineaceae bacterium]|nr:extracellular solute-binding protein [Caldilineaceae bacterium]
MHRKITLISMIMVIGLLLAACGGGGAATDTGSADSAGDTAGDAAAESSTPADTAADTAADTDLVELTHWYHQYGEEGTQQAAERYAVECGEAVGAKVTMVWVPGDYGAKLNAALLTAEAPDVFEGQPTLDMVRSGQIAAMDDIYGDALDDFTPQDIESVTIEGKKYAVKMLDDTGLLYYRKSMLEEAGIEPPTTLDELGAAIDALNDGRIKGIFMGNDGGIGVMASNILWSSGHAFLDGNEVGFYNERTVQAFAKAQEFMNAHKDGILVGAPTDWWDPSVFIDGLAAMQWGGLWAMPAIQEALGDDFGVIPWPALDADGMPSTFWGGWSQMVNLKGPNAAKALEYVKCLWIDNKDIQRDWNLSYGFHVPPRKSAAAEAEALQSGPAAEAVQILYNYGHPAPPLWTGAMGTIYGDAIDRILREGADPETEMAAAAEGVKAELERLNLQ